MTERLDKIEQQQKINTDAISALVTQLIPALAQSTQRNADLVRRSDTCSAENELRFSVLIEEGREDRRRLDTTIAENELRFNVLVEEGREDRRRLDTAIAEIKAQGEAIRALLSALANTNGRVDKLEQVG